jgi:ADP-ribosylglycohydrolase
MQLKEIKRADRDRRLGVMFGLAYGDALGRPTEFLKTSALAKLGNPFQARVGINNQRQGIVTDDTQMSIAIGAAAAELTKAAAANPEALTTSFVNHLIAWFDDPKSRDGQRAPGVTCMGAVSALKHNPGRWLLATRPDSKGNGANMRVAPLALRTDWTWKQLAGAAQLQAAITHGHPTALAASDLTAVAVRMLLEGISGPGEPLIDHLLAYAHDQRNVYHGELLGGLWESAWGGGLLVRGGAVKTPQDFIQRGWDEMIDALLSVYGKKRHPKQDPCALAGGGWVAEEALAAALHTLATFPGEPTDALRRAAFTDGDSDSIASITGALAGAAYGRGAFPSHWIDNIEYRGDLLSLTYDLTLASRVG